MTNPYKGFVAGLGFSPQTLDLSQIYKSDSTKKCILSYGIKCHSAALRQEKAVWMKAYLSFSKLNISWQTDSFCGVVELNGLISTSHNELNARNPVPLGRNTGRIKIFICIHNFFNELNQPIITLYLATYSMDWLEFDIDSDRVHLWDKR